MPKFTDSASSNPWSLNTRRIVIAGVLSAITIILAVVPFIGFIPVPNLSGKTTIEHIPTIIGAVVGGPIVGMVTGLVFGLATFLFAGVVPKDPIVLILPRIFIGLTAWLTYAGLRRYNRDIAAGAAGLVGSVTNTVLVVTAFFARGYLPWSAAPAAIATILPQAIAEAVLAIILTIIIVRAISIAQGRFIRAPETKSRDELPY